MVTPLFCFRLSSFFSPSLYQSEALSSLSISISLSLSLSLSLLFSLFHSFSLFTLPSPSSFSSLSPFLSLSLSFLDFSYQSFFLATSRSNHQGLLLKNIHGPFAHLLQFEMASIHYYFARKQVGDTQKRGKPEMRSSCRNSLDLH